MNVITSSIDYILNFGTSNSLSALLFGTSCCAKSLQEKFFNDFDLQECGLYTLHAPPKSADLLIVTGYINAKLAPHLINLYNKMPKPAYIMLLGDCACDEGIFKDEDSKNIDLARFLPVTVRLKGCPVKDEDLIEALKELKNTIKNTYIKEEKKEQNPNIDTVSNDIDTPKTPDNKELEVQEV